MEHLAGSIRGIIFDLDGTLYVCPRFAAAIQDAAASYIAAIRGVCTDDARLLMAATRSRLESRYGSVQTLSTVCAELGGSIRELHASFSAHLRPEAFLARDERVIDLMARLSGHYSLHLYTNNNRTLTTRIIDYLGLNGLFGNIFVIDDAWRAKPDEGMLELVLEQTGLAPAEALFVGDRYDIDLRLPEQKGCPVYLSQSIEQLLRLDALLR